MQFLRSIWVYGLIIVIVACHVAIIGYVRARVTKLRENQPDAVALGSYRFQTVEDKTKIYRLDLHAKLDPAQKVRARKVLNVQRIQLSEAIGQMLRQSEKNWLSDPTHLDLKKKLRQHIAKTLNDDFIELLIITDWLEIPSNATAIPAIATPMVNSGTP